MSIKRLIFVLKNKLTFQLSRKIKMKINKNSSSAYSWTNLQAR